MASPPPEDTSTPPSVGDVKRYPVGQPDGSTKCQLILITAGADEGGRVRGVPLGYEDQAGAFLPEQFA